jgi:hypothetical protein
MAHVVRIDFLGLGVRYVAGAHTGELLTAEPGDARRFRSALNADIAVGQWNRMLREISADDFEIQKERLT